MPKTNMHPAPEVISQTSLWAIQRGRRRVEEMTVALRSLERKVEAAEALVLAQLRAGAVVQKGVLLPFRDERPGRCCPPWKEIHLAHMAEHGIPPEAVEAQAQDAHPAKTREVLTINARPVMA